MISGRAAHGWDRLREAEVAHLVDVDRRDARPKPGYSYSVLEYRRAPVSWSSHRAEVVAPRLELVRPNRGLYRGEYDRDQRSQYPSIQDQYAPRRISPSQLPKASRRSRRSGARCICLRRREQQWEDFRNDGRAHVRFGQQASVLDSRLFRGLLAAVRSHRGPP